MFSSHVGQRCGEVYRQYHGKDISVAGFGGGSPMVRGYFAGRKVGQFFLPVGTVGRGDNAAALLIFPNGIISVLEGKIWWARMIGGQQRFVERTHFVAEQADRPTIGNDVVDGHEEHVLLRGKLQKANPEQRSGLEIERQSGFGDGSAFLRLVAGGSV